MHYYQSLLVAAVVRGGGFLGVGLLGSSEHLNQAKPTTIPASSAVALDRISWFHPHFSKDTKQTTLSQTLSSPDNSQQKMLTDNNINTDV